MTKRRWLLPLVLVVALLSGACGDDDDDAAPEPSEPELTELGERLPDEIKERGRLVVGSDIAYAPVEFYEEGTQTPKGIDVDLCGTIAEKLGTGFTCEFVNTTFDGIIPALEAKRFDIIMSAMSDTPERQQQIDFIDYFSAGTSILVRKGNPEGIQSLDDLCGKTVGLQKGTTQEEVAIAQSTKCTQAGKGAINLLTFETDVDAQQALKAGRSVADMNDFPVAAYTAKQSGGGSDFEVVGEQIEAGPYGIGVRKDDTELRDVLKEALEAAIADGSYDEVLETWNVTSGALKTAAINGG
jgi:polar amino acid transport system substrate-binding protein